ncbi:hypothetical protein L6452_26879 [Arctium lappa]|uniref:Uncharacterized protein n=1 Tax=Arctium lappa TaxID=4217 RepID=A0ACB8ZUF5_ARCLA|nr:hypothetical protein L6452_26879 [Arctium lappa]
MAATAAKEHKIALNVMVHKEENKVIFAEADSNFVDTLFSIVTLPLGTIFRVLEKCPDQNLKTLGCLKNLYQSLIELPASYLTDDENKFLMLNPRTSAYDYCRNLEQNIDDTQPTKYFKCGGWLCGRPGASFSTCSFAKCIYCGCLINEEIEDKFDDEDDDDGVFVPNLATFIVTDDLRVMPNTSDFSIQLVCDLGVTDASRLEKRTIGIGREQMVILVKAALLLNYPLTYLVFHSIHPIVGMMNPKLGTSIQYLTSNEKGTNLKKMTLRVTLQKSTSKFLFAEAKEDFMDFLFGFLEISLGTLIGKLMNGNTSFECFNNLFASISNMSVGECIKSQDLKDMLIEPQLVLKYVSENQIFPLNVPKSYELRYHEPKLYLKDPRDIDRRYLKSPTKFMLKDDLVVTPLSSISVMALLNKLKVPLNDVEQHAIIIDIDEGLKILNASLKSNSAFTNALLEEIIEKKKSQKETEREKQESEIKRQPRTRSEKRKVMEVREVIVSVLQSPLLLFVMPDSRTPKANKWSLAISKLIQKTRLHVKNTIIDNKKKTRVQQKIQRLNLIVFCFEGATSLCFLIQFKSLLSTIHMYCYGPMEVPSQSAETIKIPTASYDFGANFIDPKLMLFGRLSTDGRLSLSSPN